MARKQINHTTLNIFNKKAELENELTHKEKTNMKLKDMLDLTQMLLYKKDEFLYPNSPAFYNTAHPSRPLTCRQSL